jgi:transposase
MPGMWYNESMENKENVVEKLQTEIELLKQEKANLELKLKWFEEQHRLSLQKRFGRSSEATGPWQLSLFNEAESETKPEAPEPTIEEITYKRKKQQGHRDEMLKDLPVETIEYCLPEEEQICVCGGKLHVMSKVVRRELKVIPAQFSVVEQVQFVYACRDCEENDTTTTVKTAPMPKPPIPGSIASASLIAYIMNEKFVKGVPLYRQEQEWQRMGIGLSRQTMANWMIQSSSRWLKFIYDRMREHLIQKDILHADETPLQVLKEPGRKADSKSYMWLYRTGRDESPIILYEYQTTRSAKHPARFLKDFKGYLHTDGYEGYSNLPEVISVGCWAHARRYFVDALKAMPPRTDNTPTVTEEGLAFCNKLFEIERKFHDKTDKERYEGRMQESLPVINKFKEWLKYQRPRVLPKSSLGKAIQYCLNQWDKLAGFLLDGRLEIDNNRSERSIKPFVIGRKNWLFSDTPKGATSSAIIYSMVETAKENGLNPLNYLKYLLDTLPNIDVKDVAALDELMPWSTTLPENCKAKTKN